ncbi:DUF397 domain-containing protein [Streptomyces cavernicola]|uniref:DUF397 domain-containing protein n=1 Tax=Streptomyces cavernicola TaxID=3043613 RepID=A0ABT6SMQ3_9ACTN|nr:DUF397 domain-containing protein [Streptomyces sp. B-S-A6]MDI3409260.1 DUF397 domain-containing protein [Streptomyces sp. B-S-A6]
MNWFKSSYSSDEGGNCLEVAYEQQELSTATAVHIRDSKNPGGPILTVDPATWDAFVGAQRLS